MATLDHVLIVDDDTEIRSLLYEYLQKNGYRVTAVADGKGMRAAFESKRPDIVVLDLMLPAWTAGGLPPVRPPTCPS
jgi:two-component system OmpR family response regulator